MASEVLMFLFAVYRFQPFTTLTLATFLQQKFEFIYQHLEPESGHCSQIISCALYFINQLTEKHVGFVLFLGKNNRFTPGYQWQYPINISQKAEMILSGESLPYKG